MGVIESHAIPARQPKTRNSRKKTLKFPRSTAARCNSDSATLGSGLQ
jgi:hypothetical protein